MVDESLSSTARTGPKVDKPQEKRVVKRDYKHEALVQPSWHRYEVLEKQADIVLRAPQVPTERKAYTIASDQAAANR